MKALLLVAGYATRLYPLTENTPKALLSVGGSTLLDRQMREIASIPEIDEVHLVSNRKFRAAFSAWAAGADYPVKVFVWDDGTANNADRLGAVGDIAFGIREGAIDDDLFVAATDNLFTFPLSDFIGDFSRHGKDLLLAKEGMDRDTLRRFAVASLDPDGRVLSLVEKPADPPSDIGVYALYLYRRDTLPLIGEYLAEGHSSDAPGHFPEWLCRRKEVRAYLFEGECVDIGTPEAYADALARFGAGAAL